MRVSTFAVLALAPAALAQSSVSSAVSAASSAAASASSAAPSASSSASAGQAYLTQVLAALTAANLTGLVGVASAIANTTDGQALLGQLSQGNKTVFAPSNDAFAAVPANVSSNTTLLTQILSYHILNNTYTVNGTQVSPNHTIARSLLRSGVYNLPGNRSAPLVLARANSSASSFNIVQATNNFTAAGPAAAANLLVYIIPQVISLPPSIASLATTLFPSLAGVIQSTGLLAPLAASQGITVFAPNDAAVSAVASALPSNTTLVATILANHVINGSVVYSTGLTANNYTSAAGSPFTFMSNSSGNYVMSGNSTARIVQSDIIVQNGVVHLIDGVLVNTNANATAAAGAYSSGVANAQTATEATAPVTATSSPAASGASASASSTSRAAAGVAAPLGISNSLLGGLVGAVGVMLGGGYVLM